jgi:hypothetical protein
LRGLTLTEVAAADLDITIVGQLPSPQLALDDQLEAGPLQVVRLKTFLGRHGAIDGTSISCRFSHTLDRPKAGLPWPARRSAKRHYSDREIRTILTEFVQKRLGCRQIRRVEPLGEPAVD